jgi:DNA modification methylase
MKQEVSDFFIEKFTKPGEIILDPFGWLFTTAISCIKYGREYIMIEKESEYFEAWQKRISDFIKK